MDEALIREQEQQLQKTGKYYKHICWMAVPPLCMACYLYGLRPLLLCGIAMLTGNLCDRLVSLLRHRVYQNSDLSNESFALVIALLMPVTVDIYVLVAAVLAGALIGKEVFGGYGSYPFNPAAVGYAVAAVSWPEQVFRYPQPYTAIPLWDASGVPVSSAIEDTLSSGGMLNYSSIALSLGEYAAPMGTGAALVLLACGLFLWSQKDAHMTASVSFLATCALIAFFFPRQAGLAESDVLVNALPRLQCVRDELLTGAVLFSTDLLADLYTLVDTPAKFAAFVNDRARLSFYGDFLYPLASRSTLEQFYREKPDGSFTEELHACRTAVWQVLRKYRMRLLRLAPASFIHFGTTHELRALMTDGVSAYSFLDWKKCVSCCCSSANYALNNAMVEEGCCIHDDCYLEDSHVIGGAIIGSGTVLSHVTISGKNIPANVVLHSLKLTDGRFVTRIYGVADNPKEGAFLGGSMAAFGNVWDGDDHSLWQAKIYPVCDSMAESVDAALNVYALAMGAGDYDAWASAERVSLCSSFNSADTAAILEWETHLRKAVKVERFLSVIRRGGTIEEAKRIFQDAAISAYQRRLIAEKAASADVFTRMRIFYCLGKVLGDSQEGEAYIKRAFEEIQRMVLAGAAAHGTGLCAHHQPVEEEAAVRLPLRVNWGGGWSDTPPYCNEKGGTVLNAAILLGGEYPVEVHVRRLPKPMVVLESADMGARGKFTAISDLQECHNPYDPFVLHKAALIACGVIPREGGELTDITAKIGGLYVSTQMHGVPKGSGLGTSSILAGACVKALFQYFGVAHTEDDLYEHAMCVEQIMSTGGGWQDQVGGMTPGLKLITAPAGIRQKLNVRHIALSEDTKAELNARFTLIYTGQRRLARNLLRDVVGRYISNVPDSLYALEEIQRIAVMMAFELERGHVDDFAKLLNRHWELSKTIDAGSTNTCIDQIFLAIDDLIDGRMICGAGGGGFLQVLLKRGVTREQLNARLHDTFQDCGVDVWNCTLV